MIGTLGQKRVIARVVRRTVMRDCPVTVTLTCPLAIRWGGPMVRSGPLGSRAVHEPSVFTIKEKAPTFTLKTLLRHYAKWALTHGMCVKYKTRTRKRL